jgi:hypothetical protein
MGEGEGWEEVEGHEEAADNSLQVSSSASPLLSLSPRS